MSFPAGAHLPAHLVICLGCDDMIVRRTYWRKPYCDECRKARAAASENRSLKFLRKQARRYRILMHLLGYEHENFVDLLQELRDSPMAFRRHPETRSAKFDLSLERGRRVGGKGGH